MITISFIFVEHTRFELVISRMKILRLTTCPMLHGVKFFKKMQDQPESNWLYPLQIRSDNPLQQPLCADPIFNCL